MAEPSDPLDSHPAPPRAAQWMIGWLAPTREREALLGDLCEEYAQRLANGSASAKLWYWGQLIRSSPHLAARQLQSGSVRHKLLVLFAIAATIISLLAWDVFVARSSAGYVATRPDPPSLLIVRTLYFSVQTVGAMASGAVIAALLFAGHRSFWANATRYLGPVILVIIVLSLISSIERGLIRASTYLLLRNAVLMAGLFLGAAIASTFRRRR